MTDYTNNEYPANWHSGGGGANRPLHEGGYYLHILYRVLPGSNQHVERFLELRVDTIGMIPSQHALEMNYCTEDNTEVRRLRQLDRRSVRVEDPECEAAQAAAEEEIHSIADDVMREYADWTP